MKTFDEKDLITWANRDKAKLCELYYFSNSVKGIQRSLEENSSALPLTNINDSDIANTFECQKDEYTLSYACLLPVNKVIDDEPEKKYRACKNFQELFKLVNDMNDSSLTFSENECIYELISDCVLHLKSKQSGAEYHTAIRSICKNESIHILINSSLSFEDLFNEFEIEINGEWRPFGVLED